MSLQKVQIASSLRVLHLSRGFYFRYIDYNVGVYRAMSVCMHRYDVQYTHTRRYRAAEGFQERLGTNRRQPLALLR